MENYIYSYQEMVDYMLDELEDQRRKYLLGKENDYSYIFMLCNDMGLTAIKRKENNNK